MTFYEDGRCLEENCTRHCDCGGVLEPVYCEQYEMGYNNLPTGRVRSCLSHLTCSTCMKNEITDGEYGSGPWYREGK